jgi:hypothetical protein
MQDPMSGFKKDWNEAQDRMTAWWQGRPVDRVPASVFAPHQPAHPRATAYIDTAPEKYTDPETVFNNLEYNLERTYWGGEAFPSHFVYFGPLFCTAYFGAAPVFTEATTWYEPCCRNLEDLQALRFDPDHPWWQATLRMTQLSLDRAQGRYLTQWNGEIMAVMDVIAGVLGIEPTLEAMIEHPEIIHAVRDRMSVWSRQTFDAGFALFQGRQAGDIDWMGLWTPGRVVSSQCDMCAMISPEMFRDFVVPELTDLYNHLDYGIYHLDGPDAIRHVDELLKIEKLHLIQWVAGTKMGNPQFTNPLNWIDLFRKIQNGGKKVIVYCSPEQVKPLLDKLARERIYLCVYCPDETAAGKVLNELDHIGM